MDHLVLLLQGAVDRLIRRCRHGRRPEREPRRRLVVVQIDGLSRTVWDPETRGRLAQWASHFVSTGSDAYTAERRAMAMLYRETVTQAQLLAYNDDFFLLAAMFALVPLLLPLMRRIRMPGPAKPVAPVADRSPGVAAEPP